MLATDWAIERGYEIFSVIASNGKMLPQELYRVIDPIKNNEADYVTGSRFLNGGISPNLPQFRKNSIPLVNNLVKFLTGKSLSDATCGYKAYRLDLLKKANFDWHSSWLNTYGFEYYFYGQVLLSNKIRWKEVPITMRYPPKGQSYSKIKPFIGWWHMLKPWIISAIDRKGFKH